MKIAVLIASFNRVATTLHGLEALLDSAKRTPSVALEIFLLDDASPDHTGAIVKDRFPFIHVIRGTGKLFWNRGMCRAYAAARASGEKFDAYMLFNDDVVLFPDAFRRMVVAFSDLNRTARSAVAGPMCASVTGETTYHGYFFNRDHNPLRFGRKGNPPLYSPAMPDGTLRECHTFHGNCVLVPAGPMEKAGGLYAGFLHQHGDTDLGMVLGDYGCKSYLMPDHMGVCERDAAPAASPHALTRLRKIFFPPNSIMDDMRMVFRRFPWHVATVGALLRLAYRTRRAIWPNAASWLGFIRLPLRRFIGHPKNQIRRMPVKIRSGVRWSERAPEVAIDGLRKVITMLPTLEAAARDLSNTMRPRNYCIDVFLVSFPKCGRTWLELLLAQGFVHQYGLAPQKISRDLLATRLRAGRGPRIYTTHDWSEVVGEKRRAVSPHLLFAYGVRTRYWGRRVLMLVRDPRDTIVSNFYQATRRSYYPLPITDIDEYALHPVYGFPRLVRFYEVWARNRHFTGKFKLVRYEELMSDGPRTLQDIFKFTGLGAVNDETAHTIYDACAFDKMRGMEERGDADLLRFPGPNASKSRRGVIGGYRDELKSETIERLNAMMRLIPEPFRYPL